jgi:hypothetical protein
MVNGKIDGGRRIREGSQTTSLLPRVDPPTVVERLTAVGQQAAVVCPSIPSYQSPINQKDE